MRVLILGGGGHLGGALAAAAAARDWSVAVSTRSDGARPSLAGTPVERFVGDDHAPGTLERWTEGRALVIDAAAPYGLSLREPGADRSARLARAAGRMSRLISAAGDAGAVLLHVGSYLTTPDPARPGGVRDRVLSAAHPYFEMKRAMEAQALDAARAGRPVIVVNPTSLLGPGNARAVHHAFVPAVLAGVMPASYPNVINVMDVRDAAEGALRAAEAGWFGRPVTLSGTNVDVHALTAMIARLGGVRRPPRAAALAAGAATLYALESALSLIGREARFPVLPVLLTLASRPTPISAAQRALSVAPRPLADTIRDEIEWRRALDAGGE